MFQTFSSPHSEVCKSSGLFSKSLESTLFLFVKIGTACLLTSFLCPMVPRGRPEVVLRCHLWSVIQFPSHGVLVCPFRVFSAVQLQIVSEITGGGQFCVPRHLLDTNMQGPALPHALAPDVDLMFPKTHRLVLSVYVSSRQPVGVCVSWSLRVLWPGWLDLSSRRQSLM